MKLADAAFEVLSRARVMDESKLNYRTIWDRAAFEGLAESDSLTPWNGMRWAMAMEIRRKRWKSRFVGRGSGMYALSKYGRMCHELAISASKARAFKEQLARDRILPEHKMHEAIGPKGGRWR